MSLSEVIEQSEQLIKEEKYDEALALVKPKLYNRDAFYIEKVLFQCGKILMHAGREQEAWIYFNELVYMDESKREEVYLWIAEFRYYTNHESSMRYYNVVIRSIQPYKDKAKISLAKRYILEGKYKEVENLIVSVKNYDKDPELLFMLGEARYHQDNLKGALVPLKKIVKMRPLNLKQVLYFIISIELELGDFEGYIEYTNMMSSVLDYRKFQKASKILSDIERCINIDDYDTVEISAKRLIDMDIFLYEADQYLDSLELFRKGKKFLELGKNSRAIECYQELINREICVNAARRKIEAINRKQAALEKTEVDKYSKIVDFVKMRAFKELHEHLKNNRSSFGKDECNRIQSYIEINRSEQRRESNYKEVIGHIIKRHKFDFKKDVDIDELFHKIVEQVSDNDIVCGDFEYYVKCSRVIGHDKKGRDTDCVFVAAFMDKTNIITMYPCEPRQGAIVLKGKTNKKTRKNIDKH